MKFRITIGLPGLILGVLLIALPALAQRGIAAKPAPAGHGGPRGSFGSGAPFHSGHPFGRTFRGRGYGSRLGWGPGWELGWPGWGYLPMPDLGYGPYSEYGDYGPYAGYGPGPGVPSGQPDTGIAQGVQAERSIRPVLIERQGDAWVSVSGYAESPVAAEPEAPPMAGTIRPRPEMPADAATATHEVPPAVLVFRDGHQEEVRSYTIIGDTLYARANYWDTGAWTRKIVIASLDVPATLKLNGERGTNFRLPSGPGEVMIRP